ncbi:shikimate dehydrogenase family protein [Brevibacterium litoralis]|uniref:shikimate dehydrogenase family protein n=1 Tax=Brevibacterium litoralis TaxID=3138935 RepID=UPI0032ED0680
MAQAADLSAGTGDAVPTPVAAVLGSPVAHSLSPVLHAAAYRELGRPDWTYARHEVDEAGLEALLVPDGTATPGVRAGYSLTMPLKHRLIELAGVHGWEIDATADLTGAGNTLVLAATPRVLNTDVTGIVRAIEEAGAPERSPVVTATAPATATVLGNGATAASAVVALRDLGVASVHLAVRTPARARAVADLAERLGLAVTVGTLDDWRPGGEDLLVSTLPAGSLDGYAPAWPETLRADQVVLDVAYAPARVDLLAEYRSRGALAVPGTRMLVHQAVEQVLVHVSVLEPGLAGPADRARLARAMTAALDALGRD